MQYKKKTRSFNEFMFYRHDQDKEEIDMIEHKKIVNH